MVNGNGQAGLHFRADGAGDTNQKLLGHQYSGQRFVVVSLVAISFLWAVLYGVFSVWRARYRERIALARSQVPPVVAGFLRIQPPELSDSEWRSIVTDTRHMLDELMGADLLSFDDVAAMHLQLSSEVKNTQPSSALGAVTQIWSRLELQAGPAIAHSEHPRTIDLAIVVDLLSHVTPPDIPRATWLDALSETERMLIRWTRSGRLPEHVRTALHARWIRMVSIAHARPTEARRVLEQLWADAEREPSFVDADRPRLLRVQPEAH
jgi:hypothetical protein